MFEKLFDIDVSTDKVIAFVGAGGKTTLIQKMARELQRKGKRVIVTTTTHMYKPDETWNGIEVACVPCETEPEKVQGLPREAYLQLKKRCDVLLVEADGSKRKPLKVPAMHEPVIPEDADVVIGIAGEAAVGHTLREACHRPELAAKLLGVSVEHIIERNDLIKILKSEQGQRKGVAVKYRMIIVEKNGDYCYIKEEDKKIGLILLAAGNSRRFGENKLLYKINEKPMYRYVADEIQNIEKQSLFYKKIVVSQYPEILEDLRKEGYVAVANLESELGISHSIKLGIEAAKGVDAWCFMVADQPYIKGETIQNLVQEWKKSDKNIGCVSCQGRRGNPVIFAKEFQEEFMHLSGDVGGKIILQKHLDDVFYMEITDEHEMEDIDRKEMDDGKKDGGKGCRR